MKYTSLKNDIVNILHSSDFNLDLKFYDENGNTTIDIDEATWGYINNENMMIEFMTENNPVICLWKDKENVDDKMKNIIQRIRELSVLNGVSVQIRVYDNLDQRKIYNLIKSSIISNTKEKEEMEEAVVNNEQPLVESFKSLISIAKNTKKSSDFYMSEEFKNKNSENILKEMISEINNLQTLKNINIYESLNKLMTASSLSDIQNIVNNIPQKTLNMLNECIQDINNIGSFVKQKYLNNVSFGGNNTKTLLVLENVKVYKAKTKSNKEDLINAYNKLITVAENAKSGIDLLKEIKHHKILETYNVSKKDLLNLWLVKNHEPIKQQYAYVIENYMGEKIAFSDKLTYGIKTLAQYINNGGNKDSQACKNIVLETIKYNQIADFIIEYKEDYNLRRYVPKFKTLFKECIEKLSSYENFSSSLYESVEDNIDYSEYLRLIENEMGIEHPALKYIAIEEAKKDFYSATILNEEKDNDMRILSKELKHYSSISSVIANFIIENKLNVKLALNESVSKDNIRSIASQLYESVSNKSDKVSSVVSSALFNTIHTNKRFIDTKIDFINTLIKYCN